MRKVLFAAVLMLVSVAASAQNGRNWDPFPVIERAHSSWDLTDAERTKNFREVYAFMLRASRQPVPTTTSDIEARLVAPPTNLSYKVVAAAPPAVVVDMTPAVSATTHSVTLSCLPPTSGGTVTGYNFLRSTTTGGPYTLLSPGTSSTCNYTDTQGLVEGTTYFYVAQSTGPGGTSGNSNQASATIPFLPPGIPSGLSATPQ